MTLRRRWKVLARNMALATMAASLLAACANNSAGGGGGGGGSSSGPLTVAALTGFTGSDAGYGPEVLAGCVPAANLINAAGGVLGHKIVCKGFNTSSDPVDAVPAAHQMISDTHNILFVIGTGSNSASAVVPIINAAHIPIFPSSGQSLFDVNNYPYYWRMVAIDVAQGYAMAAAAAALPYSRVAAVFANTTSAMGSEPGFIEGMKLLHRPVVDTLVLPSGAVSYSSEIVGLLQTHPQLLVGELDPATAATFFTELRQLNGGKMIPVLGDEPESEVPWQKAVSGAIGRTTMDKYVELVLPASPFSSVGFKTYLSALMASNVKDKSSYSTDVYAASYFDSTNIVCLAALEAKSVVPSIVNNYIEGIANGVPGAIVVHNFAAGKRLIEQGKKIRFVGASGPVTFPKYHNWQPPYNVSRLNPDGSQTQIELVSQNEVSYLLARGNVKEQ